MSGIETKHFASVESNIATLNRLNSCCHVESCIKLVLEPVNSQIASHDLDADDDDVLHYDDVDDRDLDNVDASDHDFCCLDDDALRFEKFSLFLFCSAQCL